MAKLDKQKLIEEVRSRGVEITSINDLMKINAKYRDLVPILLRHLSETTDEPDKEFLVRCLGVRGFTEATPSLVHEFYAANSMNYKWAIGNTLSIILDRNSLPALVTIAQDREQGSSREMIVDALGKFGDKSVIHVLVDLLEDPEVVGHAISALSHFDDSSLIPLLEPFLEHEVKWIRNEAAKTIRKISRRLRLSR